MTEFERINQKRVAEIQRLLGLIDKSARSQRVSNAEIASLLAPVRPALRGASELGEPVPVIPSVAVQPNPDPRWLPAFVRSLSPEGFHSLVCAVAIRAQDDLAETRDG